MEVARPPNSAVDSAKIKACFNPCFNGSRPPTLKDLRNKTSGQICFNPCFNGSRPPTRDASLINYQREVVSILVLMEVARPLKDGEVLTADLARFQSLF